MMPGEILLGEPHHLPLLQTQWPHFSFPFYGIAPQGIIVLSV